MGRSCCSRGLSKPGGELSPSVRCVRGVLAMCIWRFALRCAGSCGRGAREWRGSRGIREASERGTSERGIRERHTLDEPSAGRWLACAHAERRRREQGAREHTSDTAGPRPLGSTVIL